MHSYSLCFGRITSMVSLQKSRDRYNDFCHSYIVLIILLVIKKKKKNDRVLLVSVYVVDFVSWWRTKVDSWKVTWTRTAEAYRFDSHWNKEVWEVLPRRGVRIMRHNNSFFCKNIQKEVIFDPLLQFTLFI